jgi:hypothetical protein
MADPLNSGMMYGLTPLPPPPPSESVIIDCLRCVVIGMYWWLSDANWNLNFRRMLGSAEFTDWTELYNRLAAVVLNDCDD